MIMLPCSEQIITIFYHHFNTTYIRLLDGYDNQLRCSQKHMQIHCTLLFSMLDLWLTSIIIAMASQPPS